MSVKADVAYSAEGPVGHGGILLVHVAHDGQIADQFMK